MSPVRGRVLLALPLVLLAAACAPQSSSSTSDTGSGSASSSPSCSLGQLPLKTPNQLTVATDSPAYPPWFVDNDPSNGKGFESAVAYAVANRLGFKPSQVKWVKVRFNNSYKPGPKSFDFDINQISITADRAKVVDFSKGYYTQAQTAIALKNGPAGHVSSLADLKKLKLGAQTGTTSLSTIRDVIKPDQQPLVFTDTNAAKQALLNGQVDAILADLYTAFYITSAEIPQAKIIGQFKSPSGHKDQFGMLFQKGSGLVPCVNQALDQMKADGQLQHIEKKWLSSVVNVPVLK